MSVLPLAPAAPKAPAPTLAVAPKAPVSVLPATPKPVVAPTVPAPAAKPASPLAGPTNQQILALTHAIALQESGVKGKPNYNAVGDNGTSHGAYQWQPGNFASAAKQYGLNPNDLSPENQDKVAYAQVYDMAVNKGYSPAQIASAWNSGSPNNFKDHSGTVIIAGKPIAYDTPKYVQGVQQHYQALIKAPTPPGALQAPPEAPAAPPAAPNLGELDATQVEQGTAKIGAAITQGADRFNADGAPPGQLDTPSQTIAKTGDLLEAGLGAAAGGAQAVFAPVTAVTQKIGSIIGNLTGHPVEALMKTDQGAKIVKNITDWATANPRLAQNIADGVTVGGAAFADVGANNPLNTDVGALTKDVAGQVGDAAASAKGVLTDLTKPKPTAQQIATTVQNHLTTGKMIADNTPGIDTQALIANTKKEMVAGLQGEGMKDAAKAVSKLDPTDYTTLDEFATDAKSVTTPKHIRDLVTPIQTTGKAGTLTQNVKAGRVDEGGIFSGRTKNPDAHQLAIEDAVKAVPGIEKGQSALESANAIHDEIGNTAEQLRKGLQESAAAHGDVQPIIGQDTWDTYIKGVRATIDENPLITGDAQATADKILNKFQSLLPQGKDITAEDILDARQGLDNYVKSIGKGAAFDPKTENAMSIALRATRQGANGLIADAAPDVAVKALLQKQSLLYDAIDNIAPKAAKEAGSGVGRVLQGIEALKKHPIAALGGAYIADKTLKATTGIGL